MPGVLGGAVHIAGLDVPLTDAQPTRRILPLGGDDRAQVAKVIWD